MSKGDTHNKILDAAEKLFSRNGYDGTATRVIASEAGITEMTLFNHFPTKELLYKTVVKGRYLAVEIESVLSDLSYGDLEKDLQKISAKLIDNYLNNKYILMMRLKEKKRFQNDERFKLAKDPILRQIQPVFEAYSRQGIFYESSENVALLFIATLKGLFHVCLLDGRKQKDVQDLIRQYVYTFCHGVIKN